MLWKRSRGPLGLSFRSPPFKLFTTGIQFCTPGFHVDVDVEVFLVEGATNFSPGFFWVLSDRLQHEKYS
jgi:hypothetical protein